MPTRSSPSRTSLLACVEALEAGDASVPVSHASVATRAGVGRATLYRHADVLERVDALVARHKTARTDMGRKDRVDYADFQVKILRGLQALSPLDSANMARKRW